MAAASARMDARFVSAACPRIGRHGADAGAGARAHPRGEPAWAPVSVARRRLLKLAFNRAVDWPAGRAARDALHRRGARAPELTGVEVRASPAWRPARSSRSPANMRGAGASCRVGQRGRLKPERKPDEHHLVGHRQCVGDCGPLRHRSGVLVHLACGRSVHSNRGVAARQVAPVVAANNHCPRQSSRAEKPAGGRLYARKGQHAPPPRCR
jgi:hypothetical protein